MFFNKFVKVLGFVVYMKTEPAAAEKIVTTDTGNEFSLSYDEAKGKLKLEATVLDKMYFAIGLGCTSMKDCDMVIF